MVRIMVDPAGRRLNSWQNLASYCALAILVFPSPSALSSHPLPATGHQSPATIPCPFPLR
ncbi:hypothetical protein BN1708_011657, partial [Verticillium longisporum]